MDEKSEREKIQNQCLRLNRYLSYLRTIPILTSIAEGEKQYVRCALQCGQALAFNGFISAILENCFCLMKKPEEAEAVGREELKLLHTFLEEYTDLLEEEYKWSK